MFRNLKKEIKNNPSCYAAMLGIDQKYKQSNNNFVKEIISYLKDRPKLKCFFYKG